MNRLALVNFWRSLTRHRLYAALNIGGLALGIAVFLVLALYVQFGTGFERWLPGYRQLYLLESRTNDDNGNVRARQGTAIATWTALHADMPDLVGTRVRTKNAAVVRNGVGVSERLALVDPAFFDLFRLKAVEGVLPARLSDPTSVVITRRTARKYFGSRPAVGEALPLIFDGVRRTYRVAAVVQDLPDDTDLRFDLVAPLVISESRSDPLYVENHQWNYSGASTYVRLPDAAARERFEAALPGVVQRHMRSETPDPEFEVSLSVRPIADVHFEQPGAALMVTTLGIIGLLSLIVAIVNYVNLATARAGLRAREVGMRKVLGADQATLRRHYVGEAVVTALIAATFGLALAELGLPLVNASTGLQLAIRYGGLDGVLLPLAALSVVVGVAAGLYPATILARIPAAAVLASARSPGGGRAGSRIREGLVVFQFSVTIALIVGTMVLVAQTRHVRDADVGYDREQLLLIRSFGDSSLDAGQRASLLHRFAGLPGVTTATAGTSVPGTGLFTSSTNFAVPGLPGPGPSLERYDVMPGFFEALGARLVAGRRFDAARPADVDPNAGESEGRDVKPANVMINRSAVRALHFASPEAAIGRTVGGKTPRTIIGVVDDMRVGSPRERVSPTVYLFDLIPPTSSVMVVRFTGEAKAFASRAEAAWRGEVPSVPFAAKTVVQALDNLYKADDQMANLFAIGAVLAVAIGCVGLWGLASFTTARRVREIGIRKTLGATSSDIVRLLVGQFMRPVVLANLLAWPLAWLAMRNWLAGFDDRISLSPLFFLAASLLTLVIAIGTVLAQSLRASRATPAWALRHE